MTKLITVEEHYASRNIEAKIAEIIMANGTPAEKAALQNAPRDPAPGADDLGEGRIAYMDAHGIDAQVISFAGGRPAMMEPEYAIPLCQEVNNEMYEKARKYPGRFYLFAHLPLSDGEAAAAELERCVKELGFVGAMMSGQYRDLNYDDEHYRPIYEKAVELDVPIYMHPGMVNPKVTEAYYQGSWSPRVTALFSGFGVGWHYQVGVQLLRMMLAGIFDDLPELKIMCGHWGELVSFYMYRTDEMGREVTGLKKDISDYFKENIWVNPSGMLYEEEFSYCLHTFGIDHICWGEDYPYRRKDNIRTFLENYPLSINEREKIAHGNVEKLLHLEVE